MNYFTIKNWRIHQQYKKRNDPWIKLHTDLLTDYDFTMLPNDSKLLLIHVWLLASKLGVDEPKIPNDVSWICGQTNLKGKHDLKPLLDNGFINMIANDSNEIQNSIDSSKINIKNINKIDINTDTEIDMSELTTAWFEEDWKAYPKKGNKQKAKASYLKSVTLPSHRNIFLGKTRAYIDSVDDKKYLKNGDTWFNQWEGYEVGVKFERVTKGEQKFQDNMSGIQQFAEEAEREDRENGKENICEGPDIFDRKQIASRAGQDRG